MDGRDWRGDFMEGLGCAAIILALGISITLIIWAVRSH
jgi:hypothetical protein